MRVVRGRHPILLLRGVQPVENNIELSSQSSALVISGPNAGGKVMYCKIYKILNQIPYYYYYVIVVVHLPENMMICV